jgi:hypothetical protein
LCRTGVQSVGVRKPANAGEKSKKSCERWKCRTRGQNVRNDCKTEKHCAQRYSKISEWLSKTHKPHSTHGTRISKTVERSMCPKCRSRLSKMAHRPQRTTITKLLCGAGVQNVQKAVQNADRQYPECAEAALIHSLRQAK